MSKEKEEKPAGTKILESKVSDEEEEDPDREVFDISPRTLLYAFKIKSIEKAELDKELEYYNNFKRYPHSR